MAIKKIKSALVSVYYKDRLEPVAALLKQHGVTVYSTGGTQTFLEGEGLQVEAVEDLTGYPSILGGRVKTLHPKVFGGILNRRDHAGDAGEIGQYEIPEIDLVIVDLYPFEETVKSGAGEADIIEKIDIGGISLIRAAAKNFKDVLIVSSRDLYAELTEVLEKNNGGSTLEERRRFAAHAFAVSSHYDTAIFNYFNGVENLPYFKQSIHTGQILRYGENPHQKGVYYGDLNDVFEQLHGKELSYNNLVDAEAAAVLINDLPTADGISFAVIKHTNACGVAIAATSKDAYLNALACDPVSAFGGVIATNAPVSEAAAEELNKLFFEILIAPGFEGKSLEILQSKKNRILLKSKAAALPEKQFKTLFNGVLEQDKDSKVETAADLKTVTEKAPSDAEIKALLFANILVKHTKSNTIVFAKDGQLLASGVGQTSRVDALKQAVEKAKSFGFDLKGSVMASDAFFPFPDCVELAHQEGVTAVLQPGGSVRDNDSIESCNKNGLAMVLTGVRHFKH